MNYCFNEAQMFMDITDGTAVVINGETGIYYGMNGFGTMVFEALVNGMSDDAVRVALESMANVPSDMGSRFEVFVEELKKSELILPGQGGSAVELDEKIAAADDYVLELSSYDDIQEMLLADPIHEVKEETGWTPETDSIGYSKEETREREKKVEL